MRKFQYEVVLQVNYGHGWDDVDSYETNSGFSLSREDAKDIVFQSKEYALGRAITRTVKRRTKNNKETNK